MRLRTKYFGEIECAEEEVIRFPEGLFGFEEETEFFLLPFEGGEGSLLCFQSAGIPGLYCYGQQNMWLLEKRPQFVNMEGN